MSRFEQLNSNKKLEMLMNVLKLNMHEQVYLDDDSVNDMIKAFETQVRYMAKTYKNNGKQDSLKETASRRKNKHCVLNEETYDNINRLHCSGYTNNEIARTLGISINTVKKHIQRY